MNDYTPSTEEVRDAIRDWEISGEQFDRWLDQERDNAYNEGLEHGREEALGLDA